MNKSLTVVILGNFKVSYTSENHHAKTLETLGHTVLRMQEGEATTEQILRTALNADLFVWIHTHGWRTWGFSTMSDVLVKLRNAGVITMSYHLDLWLGLEREKDLDTEPVYKLIEYFFATDKLMCDYFNEYTDVKGRFLPAGVFDEECTMFAADEADYEVVFVGSKKYHDEWKYRPKLINWLSKTYKDKFLHVGADGATGVKRGFELNQIYANAKVAVGDSLCIGFDYPYYVSDRLFESIGRGAFTIFPRIQGIEDWFEVDKEIVLYDFNDFDQLKAKIDYYLSHEEERETIRRAGHDRVLTNHTYLSRWQTILKEVGLHED